MKGLSVSNLKVKIGEKDILRGVTLKIKSGEIHALMGPNGSGKSTFALTLMGYPSYTRTEGSVVLDGEDITFLPVAERARRGLFLAFQYPVEIPGVSLFQLLRSAYFAKFPEKKLTLADFRNYVAEKLDLLGMDESFLKRSINEGFSGGEKKRSEILQLSVLSPSIAILDETDSGLDVDALKTVATGVKKLVGPHLGILVITHYQRLLHYLQPDFVHVLMDGRIVKSGGRELVTEIEEHGYASLKGKVNGT